jgi:hypothetical protein
VVWGEAFHYCVDVGFCAVLESHPLGSCGYGAEEVVVPPGEVSFLTPLSRSKYLHESDESNGWKF